MAGAAGSRRGAVWTTLADVEGNELRRAAVVTSPRGIPQTSSGDQPAQFGSSGGTGLRQQVRHIVADCAGRSTTTSDRRFQYRWSGCD